MGVQTSLRASKQFILLCVLIHQFGSATTSYSRRPLSVDHHYMRDLAVAAVVSLRYALVVDQDTKPQYSLPPVTWVPGILLRPRSFRQLTSNPLLSKASILDPAAVALFRTPSSTAPSTVLHRSDIHVCNAPWHLSKREQ